MSRYVDCRTILRVLENKKKKRAQTRLKARRSRGSSNSCRHGAAFVRREKEREGGRKGEREEGRETDSESGRESER